MSINLDDLGWTCMVCHDHRPDRHINVLRVHGGDRIEITVNVRYCNDRAECHLAAPDVGQQMLDRITQGTDR